MIKKFDLKDQDKVKKCTDELITKIEEISDYEIGMIAAQDIIGIVIENFVPEIYNRAIEDIAKLIQQKSSDLDAEIDLLRQS